MKFLIIFSSIFFFASCNKSIVIESFNAADVSKRHVDGNLYIEQHYLVKNWSNSSKNESILDSFVCANLIPNFKEIHAYFISFYKYSDIVNNEYFRESKKLCELNMIDAVIITYEFNNGFFKKNKGTANKPLKPKTKFICRDVKDW